MRNGHVERIWMYRFSRRRFSLRASADLDPGQNKYGSPGSLLFRTPSLYPQVMDKGGALAHAPNALEKVSRLGIE